jgi:hypothetical protein
VQNNFFNRLFLLKVELKSTKYFAKNVVRQFKGFGVEDFLNYCSQFLDRVVLNVDTDFPEK